MMTCWDGFIAVVQVSAFVLALRDLTCISRSWLQVSHSILSDFIPSGVLGGYFAKGDDSGILGMATCSYDAQK